MTMLQPHFSSLRSAWKGLIPTNVTGLSNENYLNSIPCR